MKSNSPFRSITLLIPFFSLVVYNITSVFYYRGRANYKEAGRIEKKQTRGNLDQKYLEEYMVTNKPYLNPRLKIIDLINPLCTNRTYLSSFININYGVNFNRFINRYRLKEMEQIIKNPTYANYSKQGLVTKAGFNNYQGYLRARKLERDHIPNQTDKRIPDSL